MERRCPFCYSNMVENRKHKLDCKDYLCRSCNNEFDENYALYANPRRSHRRNKNSNDEGNE